MRETVLYGLKIAENAASKADVSSREKWSTRPPVHLRSRRPQASCAHRPQAGTSRREYPHELREQRDTPVTALSGRACAKTLPDTGRHSTALENGHLSFLPALMGIRSHCATLTGTAESRTLNPRVQGSSPWPPTKDTIKVRALGQVRAAHLLANKPTG